MNVPDAADIALAQAAGGGSGGSAAILTQIAMFAAIFAIFYFLMIRPQQAQRRARERMLQNIKKGDRVVTSSGLYGTITALSKDATKDTVVLRVADQVKLEFERSAIARILSEADTDA